jgi:hypothetical protein
MKVRFTYSRSSRTGGGAVMQHHDQTHEVELDGEKITPDNLREAEGAFVEWFVENFPYHYLISWTAAPAEGGGRYSEYRAYLPA